MKSTGLWRWTGQSSKPYFLPYWGKEKQVTSPEKLLDFLHLSTPAPPWGWSRESIISQLTVKAAFSSTGFLAHEKSCLNSTRVMQSAHGNGIFQPKSQGDHTVLIILKETNAGDKRTHSLPPCKQPKTMNPKLVASGPHREIYPLCPSNSAPLASMSTEEEMFNDPHIKSWVCAQLRLPPSFTFQTPQSLHVHLLPQGSSYSQLWILFSDFLKSWRESPKPLHRLAGGWAPSHPKREAAKGQLKVSRTRETYISHG